MQQTQSQYIAIVLTQFKNSERDLYPLTKNLPLPLLPVGNKKLIVYQLQTLAKARDVSKIIIQVNDSNSAIEQYILKVFLHQFPHYPKKIEFFRSLSHQNNFLKLLNCINHINTQISPKYRGLIVSFCDTIIDFDFNELINYHQKKNSNLSLLLKKKNEFSQNEKKGLEAQIQTQIDNVFVGENGELLFIDMLEEFQNNGVKIPPQIFRRVMKGSFKKIIDSKVYIIDNEVIQIIKHLNSSEVDDVKPWLIQCLVENQANKKLLQLAKIPKTKPLSIFARVVSQDVFIKKISNKKVYGSINFDSLIRGNKQKDILIPNQYSFDCESSETKGSLVMKSTSIGPSPKIIRSVIQNNCKIGKKVEIMRSVIMSNVQIRDNCKIQDSIIASNTVIGEDCSIIFSYLAANCQIPDGSKVDNELKIPIL